MDLKFSNKDWKGWIREAVSSCSHPNQSKEGARAAADFSVLKENEQLEDGGPKIFK